MVGVMPAKAQTAADLNEGLQVTKGAQAEAFVISWWGKAGRTYFVQQSFDLMTWQYVPVVESGTEGVCGLNVSCSETRQFWRLRHTDEPTGGNAETADFDGDLLDNLTEVSLGSDPFKADTDDDGMSDWLEVQFNLDPKDATGINGANGDPDNDLLTNLQELMTTFSDPHDADTDDDTLNDGAEYLIYGTLAWSPDTDSDNLDDGAEINLHSTDPSDSDSDDDLLPDGWEVAHTLDPKSALGIHGTEGDPDADLLTNLVECQHSTNPRNADTDGDALSDYAEVMTHMTNPTLADTDGDTLNDGAEVNIHLTNPFMSDTDGDTLSDSAEVNIHGSNPLSQDSDNDGLSDAAEVNTHQTNPNVTDSDNDGITDKSEIKQGTNANNASSRPVFESVEVVGDGEAGERKTEQITITLPEGGASYFVVVAVQSDEFPAFTGTASEFDDIVAWKITPAGGTVIEGEKHVNDLHEEWEQSEEDDTSFLGLSPVAFVANKIIKGKASGTTSVQIELGAKNVSDGALPSTVAAMVIPADIMQPQLVAHPGVGTLASVSTVRFCRWRDAFLEATGGTLKPDFIASDPDRCVVRLPDAVVDPAKAWVEVKVTNITGVTGHTTDTGKLLLTQAGGYWESKPLIFVADPEDDQGHNGVAGDGAANDGATATTVPDNDQTRLAGFGAKIQIKFHPKGQNSELVLDAATLMQPLKSVTVVLNSVTKDGSALDNAELGKVQEFFDKARLIYRQIGVNLVQQGGINNHAAPASIRNLIDTEGTVHGEWTTNYDIGSTTKTGKLIDYLRDVSAASAEKQLFWFRGVSYYSSIDKMAAGEATALSGKAALILMDGIARRGRTCAHELGHCLGLRHSTVNNRQLLMYDPLLDDGEQPYPWNGDHLESKRFHPDDDAQIVP